MPFHCHRIVPFNFLAFLCVYVPGFYACVCCSLASVFRCRASPVQLLGLARVVANAHTNVASPGCAITLLIYELSVPSLPSGCAMCE